MAVNTGIAGNNFLTSFNTTVPKLFITAETDDVTEFDQVTLKHWREEGFDVTYVPMGKGGKAYIEELKSIPNRLPLGEYFAIIAYGDAAAIVLEHFRRPSNKLCGLVAYYPSSIPDPNNQFPIGTKVLVHLAGEEVGVTRAPEVLGIQGKRRTVTRAVPKGSIPGGRLQLAYPSYSYEGAEPGFAEHDLPEYNKIAGRLSWGRSLDTIRKAFKVEVDLERVWEAHTELEFVTKDAHKTMATMVANPYVNHVPTLTGGIGRKDLLRFYDEFFIPNNPPSTRMKLLSRTIGADKVVDEMYFAFEHTQEVPWMLPNVPPTNKTVEVALVSVVCIRGGKLYHEHIYWDQASVLVQIGLLDPKLIPESSGLKGKLDRLPVAGAESVRKVMDEESEQSNELLDAWWE
ncbi:uncharacterized protein PV09_05407 [Verruconis gallopava]|uniref:SnoaL-like domain-containing protein n=1 Tax=Verruconis gallopava TaxID=253628 RepID=A0A0D2A9B9_9PEZI|nr:uncharacterized protein PV09_05407 [Verruconis gallopava]KIW03180.1 hypothetical protein PV09_05407 [Verruconis gallopava]